MTSYLWDRLNELPLLVDDGTKGYLQAGGLLAEIDSSNAALYHLTDALGSVRGLTDGTGALTGTSTYDVFGTVRTSTGTTSRFGYTGELHDSETGYTFLRARYLNPAHGRFVSRDTVQPNAEGTQGYNRYGYVANNPTNWTDPSGHAVTQQDLCAHGVSLLFGQLFAFASGLLVGRHARGTYIVLVQAAYNTSFGAAAIGASGNFDVPGGVKAGEAIIGTHAVIFGLLQIRLLAVGDGHVSLPTAAAILLAGVLLLLFVVFLEALVGAMSWWIGIGGRICELAGMGGGELPSSQNSLDGASNLSQGRLANTDSIPTVPSVRSPTAG